MTQVRLENRKAGELNLGDVVARASGQITDIEFCAIHEIRKYADGRVHIVQKTRNGITLNSEQEVWVVINFAKEKI